MKRVLAVVALLLLAAAGLSPYALPIAKWAYRKWKGPYVDPPVPCLTLLPGPEALQANRPEASYLPPPEFEYSAKVITLNGRWLLAWNGADIWLNYPPSKCVAVGDELEVELCFGPESHRTYRLRREGEKLVYVD